MSNSLIEFIPLIAFFAVNAFGGLFWATGALLILSPISLGLIYYRTKELPKIVLFSTCLVIILGVASIVTQNEIFIKMKPTVVASVFGVLILGAMILGKSPLKYFLGTKISVSDKGWSALSLCWATSFFTTAILNEIVWRNFDTDTWVNFKVFGLTALSLIFAMISGFIIMKYKTDQEKDI